MNKRFLPLNGMRANTNPLMELMTRLITTVATVTIRLFRKYLGQFPVCMAAA